MTYQRLKHTHAIIARSKSALAEDDYYGEFPHYGGGLPFDRKVGPSVPKELQQQRRRDTRADKTNKDAYYSRYESEDTYSLPSYPKTISLEKAGIHNSKISKGERPIFPTVDTTDEELPRIMGIPLFSSRYPPKGFLLGKYNSWPLLGRSREFVVYRTREFLQFAKRTAAFEDLLKDTLIDVFKRPDSYGNRNRQKLRSIIYSYNPRLGYLSKGRSKIRDYEVVPGLFYWVCLFLRKAHTAPSREWKLRPRYGSHKPLAMLWQ